MYNLKYSNELLEPLISAETIFYHYEKHYKGYLSNLERLTEGTGYEGKSIESLVKGSEGSIFNNAAQVWNHEFYFDQFSPTPKVQPDGDLLRAINHSFGSFDDMVDHLRKSAASLFGSGWVWLVEDPMSSLLIEAEQNAGNPLTRGLRPLMTLDVWEHAYYIDYRNDRAAAIASHLKAIDWEVIERRYKK
ncbi:MAG: superoxide dismutase [Rikenellaceae bacterium]